MGRKLTQYQKKLIRQWVKSDPEITSADDLAGPQWDILVEAHDTEVLYQEVNYYIDKYENSMEGR